LAACYGEQVSVCNCGLVYWGEYLCDVEKFPQTVTDALVLCPLLKDRGRITESVRILVPVNRIKISFLFQLKK